ncbi:MAG: two-component sensor histidine kinase [Gammaproteobacteria bacterium]|nr:two-component sensor histidine kinase [Gammaproteobacteria bacterium]
MPSIRKFLLINLLLTITLTTYVTLVGNYYIDQKEIQAHLDILMSQYAFSLQALLGHEDIPQHAKEIQTNLNAVPERAKDFLRIHESNYQMLVWRKNGSLLLHSVNAPQISASNYPQGFHDVYAEGKPWRAFALNSLDAKYKILVLEGYDIRNDLSQRITRDDIYMMLVTYPLCGFLIWVIIGRGLNILRRVANEVANRAPSHLAPVSIDNVPVEIKPLIDELNRLFLRLQLAIEREKRFSGDAAHELRTPLAALKTQTQVALKATDPIELRHILLNVISGVDRCTHVIQQLLTLSKLAPEADTINDSINVNLVKLTAEVVAQLAPIALDKQVEIVLEAQKEVLPVMGNVTALSILVRNLVDNAIRYTPSGGFVHVEIMKKAQHIVLEVLDNGPGIPTELRERVFERFFRVLGNKSPGSGLGLAIVQQIARLHNAQVVLSDPPHGSGLKVSVSFPIVY